jgi:hypothetical protein
MKDFELRQAIARDAARERIENSSDALRARITELQARGRIGEGEARIWRDASYGDETALATVRSWKHRSCPETGPQDEILNW